MSVLTSANYQELARLLPHISAEVLARRFVAQRYSDFKVSELRTILQFLRDKTEGGSENPHWSTRGLQGAKKETLVDRVRTGLEWVKKNAGQLRESREMAARQQATTQQQQGYRPDQGYQQQPPNGAGSAAGYAGYQSSYPSSGVPPVGYPGAASSPSANFYGGQVPYINNYQQQPVSYRTERKDQNGYPPPSTPSAVLPNGYRPSQSAYSAPQYPPPSADAQLSSLLAHPNFQMQRSPYETTVQVLASQLLSPNPPHASNARCSCPFAITADRVTQLRRSRQSGGLYTVQVRLFSAATHSHVAWDKSFRVKVNAHEVIIPEPKKLSKTKKKGVELVRPLQLGEWCGATNYLEVEVVRASYLVEMFRGAVVVELMAERTTDDIVDLIRARQPAFSASAFSSLPVVKSELLSSPPASMSLRVWKPNPKRCAVCHGTKDLLRCSRCKNEWYCGIEHQRDHWATHRQQCHQPTDEQEREREAYEKHSSTVLPSAAVSPSSSAIQTAGVSLAPNGRTRLRMPVKQENKEGADVAVVGEDSDVEEDDLAEVDTIVSLKDLLLQDRIKLAVKGRHCSHLPCFDLSTFLELSQQSGVWQCPICHKGVLWDDVVVDAEMNAVLREVDEECMQIRVKPDGSYEPIDEQSRKKQKTEPSAPSSSSSSSSSRTATGSRASAAATKFTSYIAGPTSPLSVSPVSTPNSTSDTAIRAYPSSATTNGHALHSSAAAPSPDLLRRSGSPASLFSNERVDFLDNVDAPQLPDPASSSSSAFPGFDGEYQPYGRDGGIDLYGSEPAGADQFASAHSSTAAGSSTASSSSSSGFPSSSASYSLFGQPPAPSLLPSSSRSPPVAVAAVGGATLEDAIVIDDD